MAAQAGGIRAGKAFVELYLRDRVTRQLDKVERRMRAFGASMRRIGRNMLLGGGAIGTAFGFSLRTLASFDDRMSAVAAKTGATTAELKKLRDVAKELGRTTSFSAVEVAGAEEFLAQAGRNAGQIPTDLPGLLNVARAGGEELTLPVAADIVTNVAGGFQIPDELERVGDVMAAMAAAANVSILQLGQTFSDAAPVAALAGQSLEETAAAVGILGNAGVQATKAGTDIKNLLSVIAKNASIAGVSTQDASGKIRPLLDVMRDLGPALATMSEADRTAFVIEKFGKFSARAAGILTNANQEIDNLRAVSRNAGGAAARMARIMDDNVGGSVRRLMSAFEGLQIAIGEAIGPTFVALVDHATAATSALVLFVEQNQELVTAIALTSAGVAVAGAALIGLSVPVGILAFSVAKLASLLRLLKSPLASLGGLLGGLLTAAVSPTLLLAGAVAGVGGALIHAAGGFGSIIDAASGLFARTSNTFARTAAKADQAFGEIKTIGVTAWGAIVEQVMSGNLMGAMRLAVSGLRSVWATGVDALSEIWAPWLVNIQTTWTDTTTLLSSAWSGFVDLFGELGSTLQGYWQSFIDFVGLNTGAEPVQTSWADVVSWFATQFTRLQFLGFALWESLKFNAASAAESIRGVWSSLTNDIASWIVSIPGVASALGVDADELREQLAAMDSLQTSATTQSKDDRKAAFDAKIAELVKQEDDLLDQLDAMRKERNADTAAEIEAQIEAARAEKAAAAADFEANRQLPDVAGLTVEDKAAGLLDGIAAARAELDKWNAEAANAEVIGKRTEARDQLGKLQAQLKTLSDLNPEAVLQVRTQDAERRLAELRNKRQTLVTEHATQRDDFAATPDAAGQRGSLIGEIDTARAELERLQLEPWSFQTDLQIDGLRTQIDAARTELEDLPAPVADLDTSQIDAQIAGLESQLANGFQAAPRAFDDIDAGGGQSVADVLDAIERDNADEGGAMAAAWRLAAASGTGPALFAKPIGGDDSSNGGRMAAIEGMIGKAMHGTELLAGRLSSAAVVGSGEAYSRIVQAMSNAQSPQQQAVEQQKTTNTLIGEQITATNDVKTAVEDNVVEILE